PHAAHDGGTRHRTLQGDGWREDDPGDDQCRRPRHLQHGLVGAPDLSPHARGADLGDDLRREQQRDLRRRRLLHPAGEEARFLIHFTMAGSRPPMVKVLVVGYSGVFRFEPHAFFVLSKARVLALGSGRPHLRTTWQSLRPHCFSARSTGSATTSAGATRPAAWSLSSSMATISVPIAGACATR